MEISGAESLCLIPVMGKLRSRTINDGLPQKGPHCLEASILVPSAQSLSKTNKCDTDREQEASGLQGDPARVTLLLICKLPSRTLVLQFKVWRLWGSYGKFGENTFPAMGGEGP